MYICLKFLLLLFKFNEVSSACMFVDEKESSYLILSYLINLQTKVSKLYCIANRACW